MELPDFESLKYMAEQDPDELERLRQRYCRELIDSAPERFRRKLNGLLFRIDMETRLGHNSIQRCVRLSKMMMDSLGELQDALNFSEKIRQDALSRPLKGSDNVVDFPRKRV